MAATRTPGAARRRILRIISFGRYTYPSGTQEPRSYHPITPSIQRNTTPADYIPAPEANPQIQDAAQARRVVSISPPEPETANVEDTPDNNADHNRTVIVHSSREGKVSAGGFSVAAYRDQHRDQDYYSFSSSSSVLPVRTAEQTAFGDADLITIDESEPGASRGGTVMPINCGNCDWHFEIERIHCPVCGARRLRFTEMPENEEARGESNNSERSADEDGQAVGPGNNAAQVGDNETGPFVPSNIVEPSWTTSGTVSSRHGKADALTPSDAHKQTPSLDATLALHAHTSDKRGKRPLRRRDDLHSLVPRTRPHDSEPASAQKTFGTQPSSSSPPTRKTTPVRSTCRSTLDNHIYLSHSRNFKAYNVDGTVTPLHAPFCRGSRRSQCPNSCWKVRIACCGHEVWERLSDEDEEETSGHKIDCDEQLGLVGIVKSVWAWMKRVLKALCFW